MSTEEWGDPISVRFRKTKDKEVRKDAAEVGLSAGLYIRTIVLEKMDKNAQESK